MEKEPSDDPADWTWIGSVSGVKAGDRYRYVIERNGVAHEFNDPRAKQLTGFQLPDGFGLPGNDEKPQSIIVDPGLNPPEFTAPDFRTMVIYEMHVGSFAGTFAAAMPKLDYLQGLGVNAVELLPITQNPLFPDHHPADYDWGYDPVQLFAIKTIYGSPGEFKQFVSACHERQIGVIVDVVYNHLVAQNLLNDFGGFTLPQIPRGPYLYGPEREFTGYGPRLDYGRPQVRQYIIDSAVSLLREFGVDGLRIDDTIDIRTYRKDARSPRLLNREGVQLLREMNIAIHKINQSGSRKFTIAEDLQSMEEVTQHGGIQSIEFDTQWDDSIVNTLRDCVTRIDDGERDMRSVKSALEKRISDNAFSRVVYTENHDQVGHPPGQSRLPSMIDVNDHESLFARKRSTLAAAVMMSAPGIPMLFQGQEMLETRDFGFKSCASIDFNRPADPRYKGIVRLYRDLIAVRRNFGGATAGLSGQHLSVFHLDDINKVLAYRRWEKGGVGDDVIVVANFSNVPFAALNIGLPVEGEWYVRFNSGSSIYDTTFHKGDTADVFAKAGDKDGFHFNGNMTIGAYSAVILSQ